MGQLQQILARIAQAKTMAQALRPVLEEVALVVNSSACQFFAFTKNAFTAQDRRELTIQQTIVEGKYVDVVCLVDSQLQDSSFKTFLDARN